MCCRYINISRLLFAGNKTHRHSNHGARLEAASESFEVSGQCHIVAYLLVEARNTKVSETIDNEASRS